MTVHFLGRPQEDYTPLSSIKDWYDYYGIEQIDLQARDFIGAIEGPWTADQVKSLWRLCSDNGTNTNTILAALEDLYSDIGRWTTLKIHILGVTATEAMPRQMYEEILHFLPALKSLEVCLIGPDIPAGLDARDSGGPTAYYQETKIPCDRCKQRNKSIQLRYWRGLYHGFVQTNI